MALIGVLFGLLVVMAVLPAFWGVSAKDKPAWIERLPASDEYVYVLGIKTGAATLEEGRSEAARQAVGELASYLGVRMQSKLQVFMTDVETKIQDEMKATTEKVELRGGLIHDWHVERSPRGAYDVYVLLRFPRVEIEKEKARLARVMAEKALLAQRGIRQAMDAQRAGDVAGAVAGYLGVLVTAAEAEDEAAHAEALRRTGGMIEGLHMLMVSGDGQAADVSRGAREPLVLKAVTKGESGEVPVSRLPIRYRWVSGDETPICENRTDDRGLASCRVTRLHTMAREVTVQATIDTDRLMSPPVELSATDRQKIAAMTELLKTRGVEFTLRTSVQKKELKVVVLIKEENFSKPMEESLVGHAIAAKLVEAGYQVVADHEIGKSNQERLKAAVQKDQFWSLGREVYQVAQLVVVGTSTTRPGAGATGIELATSRADGTVKVVELKGGTVLAHKHLVNIAGFGQTQEQAGLNALQRLSGPMAEAILEQLLVQER